MIRLPAAADPAVSLIVLLDGVADMGERCLRAIAAADDAVPFETVLVLNDPDPALEDMVRKGTTGARVIACRANAGPAVGWNLGAAVARAPRLATLHEDSEPSVGWLAPLCESMTEHGAGAVGSRLYNGDGTVQNCGWVLFSDASHQTITEASASDVVAASEPTPADMLSGAAMLLDRDAVRAAGGWDERFHPAVFSDIDMSTAIWSQGRPVLSVPASGVQHQTGAFDHRPSTALTGPRLRLFLFERHRERFLAKWGRPVRELAPPPADAEPESIRVAVQAALRHTRERAEQVRAAGRKRSGHATKAERTYTGIPVPVLESGEGSYAVAAEVEEALNVAESGLVEEYCRWLTGREQQTRDELREAYEMLDQRRDELTHAQNLNAELHKQTEELAGTLDRIVHGKTWRLRTMVVRFLQRPRSAATRVRVAIRGSTKH